MPSAETTTKKRNTRVKRISIEDAEVEKQEAIDAALIEAKSAWEEEQEQEESNMNFGFETDPAVDEEESESAGYFGQASEDTVFSPAPVFDIFMHTQKEYEEKGIPILYYIRKDNEIKGTLPAPCDWSILQERWGGGIYKVEARHALDKRYIKSQTERVAEPEVKKDNNPDPVIIQAPSAQQPSMDMNQMFQGMVGMFTKMQDMNTKERSRDERDERKSSDTFNSTFLTLMQNQQQSSSDMFLKIAEMTTNTSKAQSENFAKVIEKMDDKFTRMFDKMNDNNSKKDSFGTLELMELMNSSRNEGIDTMKSMMEMSEALAESRAPAEVDTKDSMLSTLVKGMMPILAGANKSMQAAQVAPNYAGGQPQQRRAVHPGQGGQAQMPTQARPIGNGQAATSQGHPIQTGATVNTGGQGFRTPSQESSLGLVGFSDRGSAGSVQATTPTNSGLSGPHFTNGETSSLDFVEQGVELLEPNDSIPQREEDIYKNSNPTQQLIAEVAIPVIYLHMENDGINPRDVGNMVLDELEAQGFTPDVIVKEFSYDTLIKVAESFGVDVEAKSEWFGEMYAAIQDAAGNGIEGEEEHTLS